MSMQFLNQRIEKLRIKLLDLTRANPLISARLSPRSNTCVRIIDANPNDLFEGLAEQQTFTFVSLPEVDETPADERTIEFQNALATARVTDGEYLSALSKFDDARDDGDQELKLLDRALKDRLRLTLGLPKRKLRTDISLEEHARANGIDPSFDLSSSGTNSARHSNKRLQTLLLPDDLLRKLNALAEKDRTWSDETGISVLKLSFGVLEWFDPTTEEITRSPLVLIPVKIEKRKTAKGSKFELSAVGDDPKLNTVLAEKLSRDYGISLPPFDSEEALSTYFLKIEKLTPDQLRFKLRRQVIVGVFPSARESMYEDLDPAQSDFLSSPIINQLFLGAEERVDNPFGDDYPVDDPAVEQHVPHLVLDADPSQFSALVDAATGNNLALEGPPGTGKSQTIVNIIANAIADGKTVLFVAEKTTALEVVRSRLREVGLDKFVLPFQATRAGRAAIIESIRERIKLRPPLNESEFVAKVRHFRSVRDELAKHLTALSSPVGTTGFSVHDVLGRNIKHRSVTQRYAHLLSRMIVLNCEEMSPDTQLKVKEIAARLSTLHLEIHATSPLWFPLASPLTVIQIDQVLGACKSLRDGLCLFHEVLGRLEYGGRKLPSERRLRLISKVFYELQKIPTSPDLSWIQRASTREDSGEIIRQCQAVLLGLLRKKRFEDAIGRPASANDLQRLEELIQRCELHALDTLTNDALKMLCAERERDHADASDSAAFWSYYLDAVPALSEIPLKKIALLANLVSPLSPLVLRFTHTTHGVASAAQLVEFAKRGISLRTQLTELQGGSERKAIEKVTLARKLLSVFEWTGLVGRLFGEYRSARDQFLREFQRSYFDKQQAETILREFISGFERWQLEADKLFGDPTFKAIVGPFDAGVETPFEAMLETGLFLQSVDDVFSSPHDLAIRSVIRKLDDDCFASLKLLSQNLPSDAVSGLYSYRDLKRHKQETEQLLASTKADAAEISKALERFPYIRCVDDAIRLKRWARRIVDWRAEFFVGDTLVLPVDALPNGANNLEESFEDLSVHLQLVKRVRSTGEDISWVLALLISDEKRANTYQQLNALLAQIPLIHQSADFLRATTDLMRKVDEARSVADRIAVLSVAMNGRDGLIASSMHADLIGDLAIFELEGLYETWASEVSTDELPFDQFIDAAFSYSLARHVFEKHGDALSSYSGERLDAVRKKIVEADIQYIKASRERVAALANLKKNVPAGVSRGPKSSFTEFALLDHEASKTKRWVSPRVLTTRAGRALQGLMPCWMMSPLAVAQYLPRHLTFDICVIDEGSQMPPEDAVGALRRCKQAIVVGDTNQLPPTSFFRRVFEDEESDIDESVTEESILELANAVFRPKRRLRWHYRSKHSSLIRFSNEQIYKDLLIFPNSDIRPTGMGVSSVFVGGLYKSGVNEIEADKIAEAVFKFMKETPDRSLGVVLLNQKQQQQVMERFNRAFEKYEWVSSYVERWQSSTGKLEPFFIKNLENVQGDERDVIFIGTVYGPERSGAPVMQRFGPINGPAGRRRLNVLFTRAKEQIVTFTSMRSSDILADESANPGAYLLKRWLEYCQTGELSQGVESGREPDSEFEEHVIAAIESMGFIPVPQVGVSGFFIDIGVRHPRYPDVFLLGVECDGAAYHSSTCARDRDRIREGVLRRLGWRLHRIWSTDWFGNAPREVEKLKQVLLARLSEIDDSNQTVTRQPIQSQKYDSRKAIKDINDVKESPTVVECDDGSSYVGSLHDGKFHGRGRYRYASGDEYEGEFRDGRFHGRGIYRFADGGSYEGEFSDDQFNGMGIYRYASGEVYVGEFRNGELHGSGEFTLLSGETQIGRFEGGQVVDWVTRLPDGTLVPNDEQK